MFPFRMAGGCNELVSMPHMPAKRHGCIQQDPVKLFFFAGSGCGTPSVNGCCRRTTCLSPQQAPVLSDIKRGMPVTIPFPCDASSPEYRHHQQGKNDPRNGKPSRGTHGERLVDAAVTDAAPAADTFRRDHALSVHDIDVGRADLAADAAGDATLGVA